MQKDTDLEFELHAYVDGDLDDESMARVETYLSRNPEIAAKVREYVKQKDDLRAYARQEGSVGESPAIYSLAKRLAKRLKSKRILPWRQAMVVSLLLGFGWVGHAVYVQLAEGPEYTSEMIQAHLLSSSDPTEVLPISQERISRLYSRIGELERLPDLERFGYRPIGAQLVPSDEGAMLHVPYRNDKGMTVSYFLLHDNEEAEIPRHILHRKGVTMVYWQHDHSRYAVAAPLEDRELSHIASFLDSPPVD